MNYCITEFWNYFEKNQYAFELLRELLPEDRTEKLNELSRLIEVFHPRIGYIFNLNKNGLEFIITAYGNPYLFKSVELLVKYAPQLEKWKISAFIPPSKDIDQYKNGTDKPFNYRGISLRISEMKYTVITTENNPLLISLNIYIKNYVVLGYNDHLVTAIYTLLEHLLGEKAFANEIHFINICQLTAEAEKDLIPVPLYALPAYVNRARRLSAPEIY